MARARSRPFSGSNPGSASADGCEKVVRFRPPDQTSQGRTTGVLNLSSRVRFPSRSCVRCEYAPIAQLVERSVC